MMILNKNERDSAIFHKLMQHYRERLNALRIANDGDLPQNKTDYQRGRIAECKLFLQLDEDQPIIKPE